MAETIDLFVPLGDLDQPLAPQVERALGWSAGSAGELRVVRRSLDARKGRPLGERLRIAVARRGEALLPATPPRPQSRWPAGRPAPRVVIVGSGPAGTWAALRLGEAGVPATILEQGKPVQPRRRDLALVTRGELVPGSNYCFGEGGAGTYSDGKLYARAQRSRRRRRGDRRSGPLRRAGRDRGRRAPARRLEPPAAGARRAARASGRARRRHIGSRPRPPASASRGDGCAPCASTAASSPPTWWCWRWGTRRAPFTAGPPTRGSPLERKPIAVGVRIEHPQPLIDQIQYGAAAGHPKLPPAFYELTANAAERGVYSFCMCPGGWIVPAATEPDGVVVNGMSLSRRDSPFANSGLVVSVSADDFGPAGAGPLAGVEFQREIERAAFRAGGGRFRAPAQRLGDFLAGRVSDTLGPSSYRPGL